MLSKLTWYWKLLGFLVFVGAVVGGLFALYSSGVANGKVLGDQVGYARAWNAQQTVIKTLTDQINDDRLAAGKKAAGLEAQAVVLQAQNTQLLLLTQKKTSDIIAEFNKAHPQIAASCGMSIETVAAVRAFMGVNK